MAKPVVIAGAGISGLVAAMTLAGAGRDVEVHEMRSEIGARFHGDVQGLDNWLFEESLPDFMRRADIRLDCVNSPLRRFTLLDYKQHRYEVRFADPIIYLVRRGPMEGTLDQALKRQALEQGVRIHLAGRLDADDPQVDIVATGPRSAYGIVVGYVFKTSEPDDVMLVFDEKIAPGGYGCMAFMQGRGQMGAVLTRDMKNGPQYRSRVLEYFRNLRRIDMQEMMEYSGYGAVLRKPERNKIRIGEAGGFQDKLWGFGMRMAMESGALAAQAILEGCDYWELVDKRLTPLVERCTLNRRAMDAAGDRGYAAFLNRLAESDDPRGLIRLFHQPGAINVARSFLALGLKL